MSAPSLETIRDNALTAINAVLTDGFYQKSLSDRAYTRLDLPKLRETYEWACRCINEAAVVSDGCHGGVAVFGDPA